MTVRLIHWKEPEALERAEQLRAAGFDAAWESFSRALVNRMRDDPPDAVVIDLGRIPSQGRDVGVSLRMYKGTRRVPLVFVGGDPAKVARIRDLLPDATYTGWDEIGLTLAAAIANPPVEPVVPASSMAGYSGAPLAKKLGIKPGSVVVLDGAPDGFETTLTDMPAGVVLERDPERPRDLTLWFVRSRAELEESVADMMAFAAGAGLWIVWPKKAWGVVSDLSQTVVRRTGLAAGMVDFKVASIDATWSGLRFTLRKGS
jgi:hypothetical protein